jgi:membrane associated rhomboid family serine protease
MKDYADGEPGDGPLQGMTVGLPRVSKVVKWLLIINAVAFVLQLVVEKNYHIPISYWFGVTVGGFWQIWRYVTFQFLHNTSTPWHIVMNMLGLYILGTPLERSWGSRRFLRFYLSCGAAAGLMYVIVGVAQSIPDIPLIGASGGVYGIILACAVLFPHFRIIFLFFPVPIRLAAIIIFGGMIVMLLSDFSSDVLTGSFWSDVAHLGGAVMAAMWLWVIPRFGGMGKDAIRRANHGAWQRKMQRRQAEQADIDRILDKIRVEGLASLTRKEKHTLKQATIRQQKEDSDISRL